MRMANVCTQRLAHFALYSLPAWLKTLFDGADVAVMPFDGADVAVMPRVLEQQH